MCEGHVDPKLERSVFDLVDQQRTGKVSRRDFLKQAATLLGGTAAANALWLAANGAPIPAVAAALGALSPRDPTAEQSFVETDVNTETISLTNYGSDGGGFLAYPKNAANALAVVVIQEWWGINDQIKGVAVRFAQAGFAA